MTLPIRTTSRAACAGLFVLALSAAASAGPIIKLSLDDLALPDSSPDVVWRGGFNTLNDGVGSTPGQQNTAVDFVGVLGGMGDIASGASFTITGVDPDGAPQSFAGMVIQPTVGGTISLYDSSGALLLGATLDKGTLSGSTTSTSGSFFNINSMTITGGLLSDLLLPSPAAISIALVDVRGQDGSPGMRIVTDPSGSSLGLFFATAVVDIDALVPAPASAGALFGLLAVTGRRRRA